MEKHEIYEKPQITVVHIAKTDIITTSGGEEIPQESEFIPHKGL